MTPKISQEIFSYTLYTLQIDESIRRKEVKTRERNNGRWLHENIVSTDQNILICTIPESYMGFLVQTS